MNKKINYDVVYRSLILLSIAFLLIFVLQSEVARLLVHPRIDKYILASTFLLIIMAIFLIPDIKSRRSLNNNPFKYAFFIVAILIGLIFQVIPLSDSAVIGERWASNTDQESRSEGNITSNLPKNSEDGVVYINDNNYLEIVNLISYNPTQYVGEIIELNGFLSIRDDLSDNMFLFGRLLMWCCAADVVIIGLPVEFSDDISNIKENNWFILRGSLDTYVSNGKRFPMLRVLEYENIDKPEIEYIYME